MLYGILRDRRDREAPGTDNTIKSGYDHWETFRHYPQTGHCKQLGLNNKLNGFNTSNICEGSPTPRLSVPPLADVSATLSFAEFNVEAIPVPPISSPYANLHLISTCHSIPVRSGDRHISLEGILSCWQPTNLDQSTRTWPF
jgi:hypothetical protein